MLNDIREQWNEIVKLREELRARHGDTVYLISRPSRKRRLHRAGVITKATPQIAAIMINDETHEEATAGQIADWNAHQDQLGRKIRETAAKKDAKVHVDLGDLVRDILPHANVPVMAPVGPPSPPVAPGETVQVTPGFKPAPRNDIANI